MTNTTQQAPKKTTNERISLLTNRKLILGVLTLIMGLAVIFIFSLIPYTITPERLKSNEFITDLLMMCAIVILAMVSSIFIGQASNAAQPKSKIAKSTAAFILSKEEVANAGIHKFRRWIQKVQQPNDIQTIKERIMMSVGIEDLTIINLNIPEIKSLLDTPQKINGVAYPSLTKQQIKVVVDIKQKGIKIDLVPPEYYLDVKNLLDNRTRSERASAEGKKKAYYMFWSIASRLALTIVFSIIWTLFAKDIAKEGGDNAEAVSKLLSRLWAFTTSIFAGYLAGCQINDIDSAYITMRVDTHKEFLEDTTFTVKSVKEEAEEAFKERMQEEQRIPMIPVNEKLDN